MPLQPRDAFYEMVVCDLGLKLRQAPNRFSRLKSLSFGFFYSEVERTSALVPRVIKGCFTLDLLGFSNSRRSDLKTISESYRNVDLWAFSKPNLSFQLYDFLHGSFSDFKTRSELGCEYQLSANFAHFAINNVNSLLRNFSLPEVEIVSIYEANDPLVAKANLFQLADRPKEGAVMISLYNFFQ